MSFAAFVRLPVGTTVVLAKQLMWIGGTRNGESALVGTTLAIVDDPAEITSGPQLYTRIAVTLSDYARGVYWGAKETPVLFVGVEDVSALEEGSCGTPRG